MNTELEKIIDDIILKTKETQMTKEEYRHISSVLGDKNFLVFGTGYDSDLWRVANKNGKTIFLEHNEKWITNNLDTFKVEYTTKLSQHEELLKEYKVRNYTRLALKLPYFITEIKWDIILVDSPEGYTHKGSNAVPGRMQSIFAAKQLASTNTKIFVHDCDRLVEDTYTKNMFTKEIKKFKKLKLFQL